MFAVLFRVEADVLIFFLRGGGGITSLEKKYWIPV
jgi:hypothetical protein